MKELDELIDASSRLERAESDASTAREMLTEAQPADRDIIRAELTAAEEAVAAIETELRDLLVPKDPNDGRNVIIEIRGAEGGEEANLFARDLFDMYSRYAEQNHWKLRVLSRADSDHGGLDEIVFVVAGFRRLAPSQERRRAASRTARAGHRVAGSRAYLLGDRHGPA